MNITCGRCTKDANEVVKHDTCGYVRECYAAPQSFWMDMIDDQARGEIEAEMGYERYLETRYWADAAAFEDYEARMGLVSYEAARDAAAAA